MVRVVRATLKELEAAVTALRDGELVAFPTETVYGLGANAQNPAAVRRIFELKEHLVTIGLGLLPAYWYLWKNKAPDYENARKWVTVVLAAFCWYAFLVGHVVNNVRGFGS